MSEPIMALGLNGTPKQTNFQPVENSSRAVCILAHSRLKAATLVVIILYRMGAFHLLGQIVHGLSKKKQNSGLVNFYRGIAFIICTNQFH